MTTPNTIVCMKWGTAFAARDINVLHHHCCANVAGDLRFVCLTDDARGLDPAIEARDIPDIGLSDADIARPGVWRKLALYHSDLHDLGRVLFVDLDMAIVGDLTPFFAVAAGVTFLNMGDSWRARPRSTQTEPGTAVFSFDPAREAGILAAFQADPDAAYATYRNEQDFAAAHASAVALWPEGLVVSFKRHLCHRYGAGLLRKPRAPAPGTAIVAFHGTPRPADTRTSGVWGPAPHWHLGRVPWLERYYASAGA